jgi:hypothetical protein
MSMFKLKVSRQLLGVAMGFAVSTSALAAVTSAPTGTVMGRAPVMATPLVNYTDSDTNGVLNVGDTLIAVDGGISDLDGDTPIASSYSWLIDGVEVGTEASYVILPANEGKQITLTVKPHTDAAITDPADGVAVAANGGTADGNGDGVIDVAPSDALISVAVSGFINGTTPQVGSLLTATPACVSTCGTVTYQWQIESSVGSGSYVDIAGATNDTYMPVKDDQRRMIQVVAN